MSKRELDAMDYAELRRQNIADNQVVLKQLMADLHKMMPGAVPVKGKKPKPYQRRSVDVLTSEMRRNPSRSARRFNPLGSPPRTRSRRGSVSSTVSSASGSSSMTSPDRMVVKFGFCGRAGDGAECESNEGLDEEDYIVPERKRAVAMRDERSADELTDDDINLVADHVSVKKYDSIYGSSCHQCRQKTDDMKTICRSGRCFGVRGQFCGPCLRNRYGENAKEALKNPDWECPPCRGICNCSFCRKKQGKSCTGILIHLARENGYDNVNQYLQSLKKSAVATKQESESESETETE